MKIPHAWKAKQGWRRFAPGSSRKAFSLAARAVTPARQNSFDAEKTFSFDRRALELIAQSRLSLFEALGCPSDEAVGADKQGVSLLAGHRCHQLGHDALTDEAQRPFHRQSSKRSLAGGGPAKAAGKAT